MLPCALCRLLLPCRGQRPGGAALRPCGCPLPPDLAALAPAHYRSEVLTIAHLN